MIEAVFADAEASSTWFRHLSGIIICALGRSFQSTSERERKSA
jgi:hypothetical protein